MHNTMEWLSDGTLVAFGYVAAIYTWPWIRSKLVGAQAEIQSLRDRAKAIEAALKGK